MVRLTHPCGGLFCAFVTLKSIEETATKKGRRFFKFQRDRIMETITDTITDTLIDTRRLEDIEALAKVLLSNVTFDGTEPLGYATALAYKAEKLALGGLFLDDPAVQAVLGRSEQAA
jgi:hypothetical protein